MSLPVTPLKLTLLVVAVFGLAVLSVFFINLIPQNKPAIITESNAVLPIQESPPEIPERPNYGLPIRLKIPAINVNSVIEYVGLDSKGAMDVPKNRDDVAWFNLGSRPGNDGSAVISGHYGWQNNEGSAFDNLHKLRKGDKIYVEDENGEIILFVVRESRRYNPETKVNDNADIFGSADGKPHLNLITCEGVWDEKTQQYAQRLVVFADKISEINEN